MTYKEAIKFINDYDNSMNWRAWEKVLDKKDVSNVAHDIHYGFTDKDIKTLTYIHEHCNNDVKREKIEYILGDCNFHHEVGLMTEGNYQQIYKELENEQ